MFPDKLSSLRAEEGRSRAFNKAWSDFKRKCHWSFHGPHCVISDKVWRSPLIVRLWHCSRPSWPAQVRSKFTSQSIRPHHYQMIVVFNDNDYFNRAGLLAFWEIQKKRKQILSSTTTTTTSTRHSIWMKRESATPPIALLWLKVISLLDISLGNDLLPLSMSLSSSLSLPLCLPILLFLSLSLKGSFHFYVFLPLLLWLHKHNIFAEM